MASAGIGKIVCSGSSSRMGVVESGRSAAGGSEGAGSAGAPNAVERVEMVRARVLQTIRTHMPIETLFTPQLKIDLDLFIQSQVLIHRIAEFVEPLSRNRSIDRAMVAKHFEGSDLLKDIMAMFKDDPNPYLELIYDACVDVLNKKLLDSKLKRAIEGRIYTFKNALTAQINPEAIRASQVKLGVSQQNIEKIREEGASFIRESLSFHLGSLRAPASQSFQEELKATAEHLIPFVQNITFRYLHDNRQFRGNQVIIPLDVILSFRNPQGYNFHGMVAATVMEACLSALGYETKLLCRTDLEPKVTLATSHSIVQVVGPNGEKYLVDPSYIQFHKDICLEERDVPTSPVLVLKESEVDAYIEKNIMVRWRRTYQLVGKDATTIARLERNDQHLAFMIDQVGLPIEMVPSDNEAWVRKSYQWIWGCASYHTVRCNLGFQEIFYGLGGKRGTFDSIRAMSIASLNHYLPLTEVERRLDELLKDPNLEGKNSNEALSLIAQLPHEKKRKYASLLDSDPRLIDKGGIDVTIVSYFRSLKKMVNPEGRDLQVVYGCSGADCSTPFLATDPEDIMLVDLTKVTEADFKKALVLFNDEGLVTQRLDPNFLAGRLFDGGTSSQYVGGKHYMEDLAFKVLFDLKKMGVDLNSLAITSLEGGVQVEFPWQYHGERSPRMRRVTFVTADITTPSAYPPLLRTRLEQGIDIFYMKGAFSAPKSYPQFLPFIAQAMSVGGWLMTADISYDMERVDPEPCLRANHLLFSLQRSEETRRIEELMSPIFHPCNTMHTLEVLPNRNQRVQRFPGKDLSYWTILTLRQKTE